MSHLKVVRLVAVLAAVSVLGACAKSDAKPAPQQGSSSGDVAKPPVPAGGLKDSTSTLADHNRTKGSDKAPIWLIEISDFQCPYCKQWHDESYEKINREFVQTGKVRLAYVNYPIPSLHPNARAASEAAMCASVQGKFWELHEALFINQARWAKLPDPKPVFDSMAVAAGVNAAAWRSCIESHATLPLIDADRDKSERAGVQSTPTFFVGSVKLEGAYPVDSFRTVINAELLKAKTPK